MALLAHTEQGTFIKHCKPQKQGIQGLKRTPLLPAADSWRNESAVNGHQGEEYSWCKCACFFSVKP